MPSALINRTSGRGKVTKDGLHLAEVYAEIKLFQNKDRRTGVNTIQEYAGRISCDMLTMMKLFQLGELAIALETGERFSFSIVNTSTGAILVRPA